MKPTLVKHTQKKTSSGRRTPYPDNNTETQRHVPGTDPQTVLMSSCSGKCGVSSCRSGRSASRLGFPSSILISCCHTYNDAKAAQVPIPEIFKQIRTLASAWATTHHRNMVRGGSPNSNAKLKLTPLGSEHLPPKLNAGS